MVPPIQHVTSSSEGSCGIGALQINHPASAAILEQLLQQQQQQAQQTSPKQQQHQQEEKGPGQVEQPKSKQGISELQLNLQQQQQDEEEEEGPAAEESVQQHTVSQHNIQQHNTSSSCRCLTLYSGQYSV